MPSFLSWVDYSAAERERMHQAIALFQEHETRDELGLGTIRDAFSEDLFPGTSTIQTRLRYFLFIPWIYQRLEQRRLVQPKLQQQLRKEEMSLVEPLKESSNPDGNLGRRVAGAGLKRLPSSVYWFGLGRWGIRKFAGSQSQYHRSIEEIFRLRGSAVRTEDEGVESDRYATWHERLPDPPDGFPETVVFELDRDEALYLQDRIGSACRGSMLAHLAYHGGRSDVSVPWVHPDAGTAPAELAARLDLARRFSAVMHGASLVYNLMLAKLSTRVDAADLAESYRDKLRRWADEEEEADLTGWSANELWAFIAATGARVPVPSRRFVEAWMSRVAEAGPRAMADDLPARRVVGERERKLKGGRSRLDNKRALEQWSGHSGTARINYRWNAVQRLLNDLHLGLEEES